MAGPSSTSTPLLGFRAQDLTFRMSARWVRYSGLQDVTCCRRGQPTTTERANCGHQKPSWTPSPGRKHLEVQDTHPRRNLMLNMCIYIYTYTSASTYTSRRSRLVVTQRECQLQMLPICNHRVGDRQVLSKLKSTGACILSLQHASCVPPSNALT